jgi:hypothetical protein
MCFQHFLPGVRFALLSHVYARVAKKKAMRNRIMRRRSMELVKEIIQLLQQILSSGDEEGLRQLEETIHVLRKTRHIPGSHAIH